MPGQFSFPLLTWYFAEIYYLKMLTTQSPKKDMRNMNWNTGQWKSAGVDRWCSVVLTGDWAPIRYFDEVMRRNPVGIYGDTLDVLRAADCRIVNLECAMDGDTPIIKSGPNLKGSPEHMRCFDVPGFDVALLGNNHVLDYGTAGFTSTLKMLDARGVKHTGAGMNAAEATTPLKISVKGVEIGIVNFTEGHDFTAATESGHGVFGWDPELAARRITELKSECGTVLAIVHAGVEYVAYPPEYIQQTYRRLAEAGADAVIAHHPHVPQGIEFHHGVPIFYSLGNYIFYQPVDFHYRKLGYLLELELGESGALAGFILHPYGINDDGVHLLRGADFAEFMELMRRLSAPLPEHGAEAWHAELKARWHRGYLQDKLRSILERMELDPRLGAAALRNNTTTIAHREEMHNIINRVLAGTIDEVPEEYLRLAEEYHNRRIPGFIPRGCRT